MVQQCPCCVDGTQLCRECGMCPNSTFKGAAKDSDGNTHYHGCTCLLHDVPGVWILQFAELDDESYQVILGMYDSSTHDYSTCQNKFDAEELAKELAEDLQISYFGDMTKN